MSSSPAPALEVRHLTRRYGDRVAVDSVDLDVFTGEILGLLGPNGGGKTTLFRILSTLIPPDSGSAFLEGIDLVAHPARVRGLMGVVFQHPSLDNKLTVRENLRHQGNLYGMRGKTLEQTIDKQLTNLGILDRADDTVEDLSGGMQRRTEIAKSLLHNPRFLLLDEPSTGLDPGARIDLWATLNRLRREDSGITILLTTHLMEEAERCDRVAIIHEGKIMALDTPDTLRSEIGGNLVSIHASDADALAKKITDDLALNAAVLEGEIRIESDDAATLIGKLATLYSEEIDTITLGKPTLEDVFIRKTGHRLSESD